MHMSACMCYTESRLRHKLLDLPASRALREGVSSEPACLSMAGDEK